MGWIGWTELGGQTGTACCAQVAGDKLHLVVTGLDDKKIYIRSLTSSWTAWSEFGGHSDAPIAAVSFDGKYHFFAKGWADDEIYIRSTASVPGAKTWSKFGGTTDTALSAVAFDDRLYVFAKGKDDDKIYVRSRAKGGSWNAWQAFGGVTDVAVETVVFKSRLYVFAKGKDDDKIYMRSRPANGGWTNWQELGGLTGAPVATAVFAGDLHLFANGLGDGHLYWMICGRGNNWSPWHPLPPLRPETNEPIAASDAAVAVATFNNTLHLFMKGTGDKKIYTQSMVILRLPFEDDGDWNVAVGNWDDPGGGHQWYSFDFTHPEGGNIRAARAGTVIATEDDVPGVDPNVPGNYVVVRHADDTVTTHAHLKKDAVYVNEGQVVQRGDILALSGHTGNSSQPHLHFNAHTYWKREGDAVDDERGQAFPLYFEDKNHKAWRPKVGDELASNNS